jgi:hypothetical protein
MTWLTSLPDPIVISSDYYYEIRPNIAEGLKNQQRKRETKTLEYRGIAIQLVDSVINDYPIITNETLTTRNASIIGNSGGWLIVEVQDKPISDWEDVPY